MPTATIEPIASSTYGEIIAKYQKTAPVNVVGIAEEIGINVWEDDLPNGISGKLFLDPLNGGSTGFSIVISKRESSRARQRFTIAHEIAHFILHRDDLKNGLVEDALFRSGLSGEKETQANRLAASILMPIALIRELMDGGYRSVGALAEKLEVSKSAIAIRLGVPYLE